ncbi:MAG TPA: phosphotransferase [Gemmatimonadaceae bacterium]|nr:phosphotransferase [Gemmatimonadaceae bacterium]
MVLANVHGIPAPIGEPQPRLPDRGFHVVVLGPDNRPRYFCKCRPLNGHTLHRETRIMSGLGRKPDLATVIPATFGVMAGKIQIQVSDFVPGTRMSVLFRRLSQRACIDTLRDLVLLAERLSGAASAVLTELPEPSAEIEIRTEVERLLLQLAPLIGDGRVRAIERAVRDLPDRVPWVWQHGDFWPANILRHGTGYTILDFEQYGLVGVPLYDLFHLVSTCSNLRDTWQRAKHLAWFDRFSEPGTFTYACREVLASAIRRARLAPGEVAAGLLYYTLHMAASIRGRGAPPAFWQSYVHDAITLAASVGDKGPVELVTPMLTSRAA